MAPVLVKSLSRLSRSSLIDLTLKWLQPNSQSPPYLACNRTINESEEEDYLFTPAEDIPELQNLYRDLQQDENEFSKSHIVDRIVDGDWRRGLSLHQLAMIDLAHLEQNDSALRWSALRLVPLDEETYMSSDPSEPPKKKQKLERTQAEYPSMSPTTFVAALKSEISPLVKAHYQIHRLPAPYNIPVIRLYISPKTVFAPRSTNIPNPASHAVDAGRIMYIALPDSCPYVYISLSGTTGQSRTSNASKTLGGRIQFKVDMAHIKRIILEAIPKALSRPHERWALESTKLTAKSLRSICELRGHGKPGSGGGAYSKFSCDKEIGAADISPVEPVVLRPQTLAPSEQPQPDPPEDSSVSQRQAQIQHRFGNLAAHHAPLDRFHVTLADVLRPPDSSRPTVEAAPISLTFSGSDVFRGIKMLAEMTTNPDSEAGDADSQDESEQPARTQGPNERGRHNTGIVQKRGQGRVQQTAKRTAKNGHIFDINKLPSWMTGELGMSSCTV